VLGKEHGERYRLGDLVLDVPSARLSRSGVALEISGLTFDLLVHLVRTAPAIATHQDILDQVWADAVVGEETLKQRIRLLRRALTDDSTAPRYVRTVRGRGYQWLTPVVPISQDEDRAHAGRRAWWIGVAVIALVVVAAVWLSLRPRAPEIRDSSSVADLVQRARTYYLRYQPDDNEHAIALLERAIEIEPRHAEAHALMSRAFSQQPKLGNGYWGAQAKAAADQAIDLAPDLAEAHLARGIYFGVKGRPDMGVAAYEQALRLEPDNAIAWSNVAYDLMLLGRLDEALTRNLEGMNLNPDAQFGMVQMGDMLRLLGYPQKAEAWFEKAITLQPDNPFARISYSRLLVLDGRTEAARGLLEGRVGDLWGERHTRNARGDSYLFEGDFAAAREQYRASWEQEDLYGGFRLAILMTAMGDGDAEALVGKLRERFDEAIHEGYACPDYRYYSAALALAANQEEQALALLAEAVAAGWRDVAWTLADPAFRDVRENPDFTALIEEMRTVVARQRAALEQADRLP